MLLLTSLACTGANEVRQPGPTPEPEPVPITAPTPPDGTPFLQFVGDRPKNVLMISMDTTRRDHFAAFSPDGAIYTPFLAEIADQAVVLEDHQQCSNWTFASTSCTLAGRYSLDAEYMPKLTFDLEQALPDGQRSLALRLGEHGFYSVLVSSNAWLSAKRNNAQGYDEAPELLTPNTTALFNTGIESLTAAGMSVSPTPWLLHVHLVDPHPPYTPPVSYRDEEALLDPIPEEWDLDTQAGQYEQSAAWPVMTPEEQELLEAHLRARYHGELRYMDDQIRAMWDTLEAGGWLDDTLVVFWTDHGEQFWEHGEQTHAYYLGAEENDGVLIFWAKNLVPRLWTEPTHAVDLVPTVLEAVGHPPDPTDPELSGYVLGTAPDTRPRFGEVIARLGVVQSVTLDGWKMTFNFSGVVKLYDRNTDRYEALEVYTPDHPKVAELWDLLSPRILRMSVLEPTRTVIWPEELPHP